MKNYLSPILFTLAVLALFSAGVFLLRQSFRGLAPHSAEAGLYNPGPPASGHNLSGFAWSSTYGWISFNSTDCDADCAAGATCTSTGVPAGCPVGTYEDYGVTIIPSGANAYNLSGYAWNSNLGWVSFQENTVPDNDYSDLSGNAKKCLNDCNNSNNCTACFSYADGHIYGWAKVLALGDDGWVRLDDDNAGDGFDYGLVVNNYPDIEGYAWGGGTGRCVGGSDDGDSCPPANCAGSDAYCQAEKGIGWVSFSGASYGVQTSINMPPTVSAMTAPNWGADKACVQNPVHTGGTGNALGARLEWTFSDSIGDTQSAYQVRVCRNGFSETCSGGNFILDTGQVASPAGYYEFQTGLDYSFEYSWGVRVWDDKNLPSSWIEFRPSSNPADHQVVGGIEVSGQDRWRAYAHEFPQPEFSWFPQNPAMKEEVEYSATTSLCYLSENVAEVCPSSADWDWSNLSDSSSLESGPSPDGVDASTTVMSFNQAGLGIGIRLDLTYPAGSVYSCATSSDSDRVKQALPDWREGR